MFLYASFVGPKVQIPCFSSSTIPTIILKRCLAQLSLYISNFIYGDSFLWYLES